MTTSSDSTFKQDYHTHLQHLKLKGLQPKTIEDYSRAIRRIGEYFEYQLHDVSEQQLLDYFTQRLSTHSWSAVKLDLYLSRSRIPRLECVDFAGGPGAKAQDESAISSLCNKVNCAARENALGCNALR